jgi:ABC-type transporter Mla subunit MlaD
MNPTNWPHTTEVGNMSSSLQLLQDKRSSAAIDARTVEAQLARLTESAEAAGIKTNLRSVAKLFRDYIATLDESIQQVN